jgi:hypothetical protein
MNYEQLTQRELNLYKAKNRDYTQGGSTFGNFERVSSILALYPKLKLSDPRMVWPTNKDIKIIYVAGAFRARSQWEVVQNVRRAEEVSLKLWKFGYSVICPHTMTQNFSGECSDKLWLDGCLELLKRCDAIYLLEYWTESKGSLAEYKLARELGLVILGDKSRTCSVCGCYYTEVLPGQKCPRCKGE